MIEFFLFLMIFTLIGMSTELSRYLKRIATALEKIENP